MVLVTGFPAGSVARLMFALPLLPILLTLYLLVQRFDPVMVFLQLSRRGVLRAKARPVSRSLRLDRKRSYNSTFLDLSSVV